MNLKENTNLVFQQISNAVQEAGRENDSVSVIAVTKYVDVDTASDLVTAITETESFSRPAS